MVTAGLFGDHGKLSVAEFIKEMFNPTLRLRLFQIIAQVGSYNFIGVLHSIFVGLHVPLLISVILFLCAAATHCFAIIFTHRKRQALRTQKVFKNIF